METDVDRQTADISPWPSSQSPDCAETSKLNSGKGCIHSVIAAQSQRFPERVAVTCGEEVVSYGELELRAGRLAAALRKLGVGPNVPVAVYARRSAGMVVGIYAVLKAGGVYVPLDPSYPAERLSFMLDDTAAPVLLAQRGLPELRRRTAKVVWLDDVFDNQGAGAEPAAVAPDNLAYIIYTSGSTGKPKGVMITHRNLYHSTTARLSFYPDSVDAFLLLSSFAFDSSVAGIFWTLSQGGKLVLPPGSDLLDPPELARLIQKENVSHLLCLPSLHAHLIECDPALLASLRTAIVAGEACPCELLRRHRERVPNARLFNEYGPTEATVWSTVFDCERPVANGHVPIGHPLPGTRIYLLDGERRTVARGEPGEIYIGGAGVAAGYLNQPELTAERFIPDPFSVNGRGRLYRTGDIARSLSDGTLEFLGREDHQVKIRGYRIELEEIESVIREFEDVEEVAVMAWDERVIENATDASARTPGSGPAELAGAGPEELARDLALLETEERERLLAGVEAQERAEQCPALRSAEHCSGRTSHWERRRAEFEVSLRIDSETFLRPPRESQRNWLANRALDEFASDLAALNELAKRFVPGAEIDHEIFEQDRTQSDLAERELLEDWHIPLMKAMAEAITERGGDVLEIGFGRGISATFLQDRRVRSHTIIECNDSVIRRFFEPWRRNYPDRDIRLVRGRWQEVIGGLGEFDGIFFQTYPLNREEFVEYLSKSVTFAEHFFPTASRHLRSGGAFTYLTHEIDSLSRGHQRLIFQFFNSMALRVQLLRLPKDCRDLWWSDSMVVVKAVK